MNLRIWSSPVFTFHHPPVIQRLNVFWSSSMETTIAYLMNIRNGWDRGRRSNLTTVWVPNDSTPSSWSLKLQCRPQNIRIIKRLSNFFIQSFLRTSKTDGTGRLWRFVSRKSANQLWNTSQWCYRKRYSWWLILSTPDKQRSLQFSKEKDHSKENSLSSHSKQMYKSPAHCAQATTIWTNAWGTFKIQSTRGDEYSTGDICAFLLPPNFARA